MGFLMEGKKERKEEGMVKPRADGIERRENHVLGLGGLGFM